MPTRIDLDRYNSRRSTVYAPRGVVSTSQPLAASAGIDTLRTGGNAFDAAVAAAATLAVVEPMSTGIGGDVFAMFRTARGDVGALRSCGSAPAAATIGRVKELVGDGETAMPMSGPLSITVPGTVRGWERIVSDLGRLSLPRVLAPAITYANDGYPVTEQIAEEWRVNAHRLAGDDARDTFLFGGAPPNVGQTVTVSDLGETLGRVAEEGADVFYEGSLAERIADTVRGQGGLLSAEDLRTFSSEFVKPLSTTYDEATVYELPPNNQGPIVLEALNIASELDVGRHPRNSADRVHYLAEALKRAFVDGHRHIADPDFATVPDFHDRSRAVERAGTVTATASDVEIGGRGVPDEDSDTVLVTAGDEEGNVVSLINSLYKGFGSGIVVPGTGIVLQNRGSSFSLDSDHPNSIAPGKRPFHTLIPGLVGFDANDWAAFGVMGGYMQPQGHLQLLSNLIDYGLPLQAALDAPRWRYLEDGRLALEARLVGQVGAALSRRGHDVCVLPPRKFGGAQVSRRAGGVLSGASDPRKDGIATGY